MNGRARYLGMGAVMMAVALLGLLVGTSLNTEARAQAEDSPLMEAMNTMNSGYRAIRRVARRGNFDEEIQKTAAEMTKAALVSMHEVPPLASQIPTAEREQFLIDYKKMSAALVKELLDLEIAMLEGRTDDVNDHLVKLADMQNEGHDKFMDD